MTGHIYRDVILEQHVRLFRGAMGAEFLFMDDNARPHRANIVDECLQSEDITLAQQPMRARVHCVHPSTRDHWSLRYKSRCPDQVVSLKRDPQCLSPQASLVLIYRPTTVRMKGCVDLAQPGKRTRACGVEAR
ncbi:transposable element Tcb1 transposase [Trichonephila clavipes]|nr:transposable element Tcb1 transposase [Trichonephila clavipes]